MIKKTRLQKLLSVFSPDGTQADFAEFDKSVATLKSQLKEKIQAKTLEDVNGQLDKFRKRISIQPLVDAVDGIRNSIDEKLNLISEELDIKSTQINTAVLNNEKESGSKIKSLKDEIALLKVERDALEQIRKKDLEKVSQSIPDLTDLENRLDEIATQLSSRVDALETPAPQVEVTDWQLKIDEVRKELMNRMSSLGGGSMNRNISVGGNSSVLTKYTDLNIKAGSNVTLTYSNNDTTKNLDLTIAATGGSGTTRQIQTTTVSSVIAGLSGIDQVTLANGGVKITLPTAVGDTQLYTIKNVGTSSVLVETTGGQTIDGDTTIIMPVRYTSVDIISDSANWNVT